MGKLDMLEMAYGMATHEKKLKKKYGVTPKENALMAYHHKQPYVVPNGMIDGAIVVPGGDLERYAGRTEGKDGFGVEWVFVPEQNAPMVKPGSIILEDIADWREVVHFPDLEAFDWEKQADLDLHEDFLSSQKIGTYQRLKNNKTITDGGKFCFAMILNGPFERLHSLMGFENALIALLEDPESCYEFFGAMADYKIELLKKIKKYYNPDVIQFHDDYGASDRMFMSLDTWRELLKPHIKRVVDATHEMGIIYEHHSCGYMEPLIPEFIEIGVDAVDPLSPYSNHNLKELKKKYGHQICFVGCGNNIEVYDRKGVTEEECRAEYRRTIEEIAPGGSYVAFPVGLTTNGMLPCMMEHFSSGVSFYEKQGK